MPGDPNQCREYAARFSELAANSPNPSATETYLSLAETWERLAAEHESGQAFLAALQAIEAKPSDRSALADGRP
jgi:hypothetical protein